VGNEEAKQKSYITWSESDSDDSEGGEGEILNSLVAQFGVIENGTEEIAENGTLENVNQESESESDTDEQDLSFEKFRILIEDLVQKKKDNEVLNVEKESLAVQVAKLEKELSEERTKSEGLEKQLAEQLRNIKMLNNGTKDQDKLLTMGRTSNVTWGLGYNGGNTEGETQFVKGSTSEDKSQVKPTTTVRNQFCSKPKRAPQAYNLRQTDFRPEFRSKRTGCWYCGGLSHYKADWYNYLKHVVQTRRNYQAGAQGRRVRQVYVKKGHLQCHAAQTSANAELNDLMWCFDSGFSRHMTGTLDNLAGYKDVPSRKVIFGDGGHALVKGKGYTSGQALPHLTDVYHVDRLKANLISISQLCDDGLSVVFTQTECKAFDKHGFVKMEGHRAANNCYMWNPEESCYTTSQIDESTSEDQPLVSLSESDHMGEVMSSVEEFTIVHNELAGSIQVHNQQGMQLFSLVSDQFVWLTCLRWLGGGKVS